MADQILVKLSFAKRCLLAVTGFAAIAGPFAAGLPGGLPAMARAQEMDTEMKHYNYKSSESKFELDIPKRWNSLPAVPSNSPREVIHFASFEDGTHLLIVFRSTYDPQLGLKATSDEVQEHLAKAGFSHFVTSETTIGSRRVMTLDFDKLMPEKGGTWSCRHYFVIDGTVRYTLGFGTNKRDAMFDLFDRMAKSFVSEESPG
jgi:hypothetical protein